MNEREHLHFCFFNKGVPLSVRLPIEEYTPEWQEKLCTEGATHPMEILEFPGGTPEYPTPTRPIIREHSPVAMMSLRQVTSPAAISKLDKLWSIAVFSGLEPEAYKKSSDVAQSDVSEALELLKSCTRRAARLDHDKRHPAHTHLAALKAEINMTNVWVDLARASVISSPYTEGRKLQKCRETLNYFQTRLDEMTAVMNELFPDWKEDLQNAPDVERAP